MLCFLIFFAGYSKYLIQLLNKKEEPFTLTDFKILGEIGYGVQAKVLLASVKMDTTEKFFAIKEFKPRYSREFKVEAQALDRLDGYEHVMKLCRDVGYPAGKIIASSTILLEYCPGGDIFGYVKVFAYLPDPFDPKQN